MADVVTIEPLLTHPQVVADIQRRLRYAPAVVGHDPRALPPIGPNNLPMPPDDVQSSDDAQPTDDGQPQGAHPQDTQPRSARAVVVPRWTPPSLAKTSPKPSPDIKEKRKSPPIPALIAFVEKHEQQNAEWQVLIDLMNDGISSSLMTPPRGSFIRRWLGGRRAGR